MNSWQQHPSYSKIQTAGMVLITLGWIGLIFSMTPGLLLITDDFANIIDQGSAITDTAERVGYFIGLAIFFGAFFLPGWIISAACLLAGWQIRNLRWQGFGIFVAILAIIPCYWNLCLPGPIAGIWLLIVLLDVESIQLFNRVASGTFQAGGESPTAKLQTRINNPEVSPEEPLNPYESPKSDQDRFH